LWFFFITWVRGIVSSMVDKNLIMTLNLFLTKIILTNGRFCFNNPTWFFLMVHFAPYWITKVGFTPKISRDIFIPFNPLSIWGLKGWKYNNKLTHVCYSHKGDNEIGYLFQWQVTFEVGTSKTSLGCTTCFILLK